MSSGNALDVSSSDKKLWLVKFPPMVAQRLHAMAMQSGSGGDPAGQPVGRVRVTHNTTQVLPVCDGTFRYASIQCCSAQGRGRTKHPNMLSCALQTSSDFRLELDPAQFPSIPKEYNMRPHADGVQDAYCFNRQGSGSIGASIMVWQGSLCVSSQCGSCKQIAQRVRV